MTSSGARSGWISARLYNQSGALLAISNGNASGMGGSTTFPASLSAPAPATAGTYTWRMAYFGNSANSGDVHGEKSVNVSFTVAAATDTTVPVVSVFTLPATATSLTVPVSSFTATDNVGVTGYLINKVATAPLASAAGWTATAPASVTAVEGSNTFYAWVKDAAGNVSLAKSASVTVTLPDTTVPVVSAFTLPATATNLTVLVTTFTATDNVGVTGYLINKVATAPLASAAGWTATAPASVTAVEGGNTFYAWAKDAAGNVSLAKTASVTVALPPAADTTVPVVSAFTLPATSTTLTVPVSAFTATDNVGVTGYLITTSSTAPTSGWLASAPASVTAVEGSNTFYAYVRDAAGNVSLAKTASVTVTLPQAGDTTNPTLTISAMANGTQTNKVTLNISGTASDAGGLQTVTVNGEAVVVNADGTFSTALTLVAGANTVTVIATDKAGNQTTDSRVITYDASVPVLTIAAPADNSTTTQSFITLTGTISETSTVSFSVNGNSPQSASLTGSTYSATAYLMAGVNTITITATDLAGNIATAKRTVTYSAGNNSLGLAVTSPSQDITTRYPSLVLRGRVADDDERVTVKITMNGRTYTPEVDDGEFRQRLTFSTPKLYAITVTATDEAGNSSTVVRNVIYRPGNNRNDD
jgi:hypothetical protein